MLHALNRLSPFPDIAPMFDQSERFRYLGAVEMLVRGKSKELAGTIGGDDIRTLLPPTLSWSEVNWDAVLRAGNRWHDRMVKSLQEPERELRSRDWDEMMHDFYSREKRFNDKFLAALGAAMSPKDYATERISLALFRRLCSPGPTIAGAETRLAMRLEIVKLGYAMAAYHADHGSYPWTLAELAPNYITKIPKDIYSDADLHYSVTSGRQNYLIYSVGPNGVDDDGNEMEDAKNGEGWDDIVLKVPGPAKSQEKR
jgi:hypothetical protein